MTSLRWRLEYQSHVGVRFIHLTDSLVCLHCLTRRCSSSRKLRRTLARINALLLASNSQPLWGYMCIPIKIPPTSPVVGAGGSAQSSAMPRKRILEAERAEERARQRRELGTLKQLTEQPATRLRYTHATNAFLRFLSNEGHELPRERARMDPLVCDYLEHLWSSGAGRALACDTLAGLLDLQPNLRNHLPGARRLLKTWHVNEIPNRAPPLPEHVVQAMAGRAFFRGHYTFGISLLVGFYTMIRTGELIGLRSCHMTSSGGQNQVLISLGLTKGGKRHGAAESVILGYEPVVKLVQHWKLKASPATGLSKSPANWRGLFNECLQSLKLTSHGFRPYSLRRGGATFWFSKHQSFDRILVQGRWHTQKSAQICLNEGLSVLATLRIPQYHPDIHPFLTFTPSLMCSTKQ